MSLKAITSFNLLISPLCEKGIQISQPLSPFDSSPAQRSSSRRIPWCCPRLQQSRGWKLNSLLPNLLKKLLENYGNGILPANISHSYPMINLSKRAFKPLPFCDQFIVFFIKSNSTPIHQKEITVNAQPKKSL